MKKAMTWDEVKVAVVDGLSQARASARTGLWQCLRVWTDGAGEIERVAYDYDASANDALDGDRMARNVVLEDGCGGYATWDDEYEDEAVDAIMGEIALLCDIEVPSAAT